MKRFVNLLLLFLASCATRGVTVTEVPVVVATRAIPTATSIPPTALPSITPTTTQIPCDPFTADFCITEGHFLLQRPIHPPAKDLVDPTYRYASTANETREPHHGVEFPTASGTPVYAAAEGIILFAGADTTAVYSPWPNFYGNLVVIEHADGLFTLYAHLSKLNVAAGQKVFTGDQIGEVGRTGVAIGSHLHFEVRRGNDQDYFATQNPELWLIPTNATGVISISIVDPNHRLVQRAKITLQYYLDRARPPAKSYYAVTYPSDMLNGEENAAFGDLSAGQYRIVVEVDGQIHERWVEVESGKLTQVAFIGQ